MKTATKNSWLWIVLELRVKIVQFCLSKSFNYVKNQTNPYDFFFIEEYKNGRTTSLLKYFYNFDFQFTLFSENIPN